VPIVPVSDIAGNPALTCTLAVSDVYQDLFGEGSYVGKGIYDVAAFERSLVDQVRENTLLSHDLFEGIYGRAALVTDIILYEEYPTRYLVYTRRMHRWIRGDWQLFPWLLPIVRTKTGLAPNRLSIISRWKVFDNLRRSLLLPTMWAFFAAGWLALPGSPLVWTLLVLLPSLAIMHKRFSIPTKYRPLSLKLADSKLACALGLAILFYLTKPCLFLARLDYTDPPAHIARNYFNGQRLRKVVWAKCQSETWLEMVLHWLLPHSWGSVAVFNQPR
jgi:hypothetical protein